METPKQMKTTLCFQFVQVHNLNIFSMFYFLKFKMAEGGRQGDDTTIYLWSRNGSRYNNQSKCLLLQHLKYFSNPRIMLPDGVGFKIGQGTRIQHLVLQVTRIGVALAKQHFT